MGRASTSAGNPTMSVLSTGLPAALLGRWPTLLPLLILTQYAACVSASSSSIVFGMSCPFSGSNSFLGFNTYAGISAAFSRSNRLSALPVNLTLVALDDGYNPTVALSNIQQLSIDYNLLGVLGAVGTPTVQNLLPYLAAYSIPLYGPVTAYGRCAIHL